MAHACKRSRIPQVRIVRAVRRGQDRGVDSGAAKGWRKVKVIIAGSRSLAGRGHLVTEAVSASGFDITEVVSGTAPGIDLLGEAWAARNEKKVARYPANWSAFGRAAGPIRNKGMAEYADALIAIWDGSSRGTENMMETMRSFRKPVFMMEARSYQTAMHQRGGIVGSRFLDPLL
jgi:SLOG family YspA-like protein